MQVLLSHWMLGRKMVETTILFYSHINIPWSHFPLLTPKAIADYVYEAGDDSLVNDPWRVNKEGSVVYVAQVREKERKRERERERERESIV